MQERKMSFEEMGKRFKKFPSPKFFEQPLDRALPSADRVVKILRGGTGRQVLESLERLSLMEAVKRAETEQKAKESARMARRQEAKSLAEAAAPAKWEYAWAPPKGMTLKEFQARFKEYPKAELYRRIAESAKDSTMQKRVTFEEMQAMIRNGTPLALRNLASGTEADRPLPRLSKKESEELRELSEKIVETEDEKALPKGEYRRYLELHYRDGTDRTTALPKKEARELARLQVTVERSGVEKLSGQERQRLYSLVQMLGIRSPEFEKK